MLETVDSRAAILAAARRLFVEKGYRGISMREIAEAVGMTKAALYYHFRDKEQLFVAILQAVLSDLSAVIAESRAGSATCQAQIEDLVQRIMLLPPEERASLRLASQELGNLDDATRKAFVQIYHEQFIGRITAIFEAGMTSGEFKPLDPNVATWSLLGMMYPYFHVSPVTGTAPSETLVAQLMEIFFGGIHAP